MGVTPPKTCRGAPTIFEGVSIGVVGVNVAVFVVAVVGVSVGVSVRVSVRMRIRS